MKTPHTFSDPLPPVDCRWVAERLHAHVEGEAAPLESRLIRTHLQNCSDCRGLEQAFQNDRRFFLEAALDSPALPATFSKKVLRKIERTERDELRRKRKAYAGRMLGGAAAALVLAAAGLFGLSFFRAPGSPEGLRSARLAAVDPASTPVITLGATCTGTACTWMTTRVMTTGGFCPARDLPSSQGCIFRLLASVRKSMCSTASTRHRLRGLCRPKF